MFRHMSALSVVGLHSDHIVTRMMQDNDDWKRIRQQESPFDCDPVTGAPIFTLSLVSARIAKRLEESHLAYGFGACPKPVQKTLYGVRRDPELQLLLLSHTGAAARDVRRSPGHTLRSREP